MDQKNARSVFRVLVLERMGLFALVIGIRYTSSMLEVA